MLLVFLILVVPHVRTLSWHGGHRRVPAPSVDSQTDLDPETFWWRNRRRVASPAGRGEGAVGVRYRQGAPKQRVNDAVEAGEESGPGEYGLAELGNHITSLPQPARHHQSFENGAQGWGFLSPLTKQRSRSAGLPQPDSAHYVSFHYSLPVFNTDPLRSMNRRTQLHGGAGRYHVDTDREVIENVISQSWPAFGPPVVPVAAAVPKVHHRPRFPTPAPRQHKQGSSLRIALAPAEAKAVVRPTERSSITRDNSRMPTGFGVEIPAVDAFAQFSSLGDSGFGSFDAASGPSGFTSGFGEPVAFNPLPSGSFGGEQLNVHGSTGHQSHPAGGFGGLGGDDTDIGEFGWKEPGASGQGHGFSAGIQPIPTASAETVGTFANDDVSAVNWAFVLSSWWCFVYFRDTYVFVDKECGVWVRTHAYILCVCVCVCVCLCVCM